MRKPNINNEKIKRKFIKRLREAEGLADSTIYKVEQAIFLYEDFTENSDFKTYNPDKAIALKNWLKKRKFNGKPISISTRHSYLRNLRKFFLWLSREPGYISKIPINSVAYLRLRLKEGKIAAQYTPPNFPTRDYVGKLFNSIDIKSEVDHRNSALVSCLHLTGMRVFAISTLPICCFDEEKLIVDQDPQEEVHTKFSKRIFSIVFNFDNRMLDTLIGWKKFLVSKGFGMKDPLFPRSKLEHQKDGLCFESATKVEPVFWKGTGRIREILEKISKEAGMEYFPPHTFRHLTIYLAIKYCRSIEQFKALSQNFGHEDIITILRVYANYAPYELQEILGNKDFSGEPPETLGEKVDKINEFMREFKKNYLDKEH